MKVKVNGDHNPHAVLVEDSTVRQDANYEQLPVADFDPHAPGPRPIGTLMVIAILLLVTIAFWMMVLGIQQGRA